MAITTTSACPEPEAQGPRAPIPQLLAQWIIEAAFLPSGEMCLERFRFASTDPGREPPDGGYAMKLGLLAGGMAEHELWSYASDSGFTIDLAELASRRIERMR